MSGRFGSYAEYLEENKVEHNSVEANKYFAALALHRVALAEELGITLDELHRMNFQTQSSEQGNQIVAA